jgi:hypothetical protein
VHRDLLAVLAFLHQLPALQLHTPVAVAVVRVTLELQHLLLLVVVV